MFRSFVCTFLAAGVAGCTTTSGSASSDPWAWTGSTPTPSVPTAFATVACTGTGLLDHGQDGTIEQRTIVEVDANGAELSKHVYDADDRELVGYVCGRTLEGRRLWCDYGDARTEWTYNVDGNELAVQYFEDGDWDREYVSTWSDGHRVEQVFRSAASPNESLERWAYAEGRELESTLESTGQGIVERTRWFWPSAGPDHIEEWDYEDDGTIDGVSLFLHDGDGREIYYHYNDVMHGQDESRETTWDSDGRVVKIKTSGWYGGSTTSFTYGADGRLAEERVGGHDDVSGFANVTTWTWTCP